MLIFSFITFHLSQHIITYTYKMNPNNQQDEFADIRQMLVFLVGMQRRNLHEFEQIHHSIQQTNQAVGEIQRSMAQANQTFAEMQQDIRALRVQFNEQFNLTAAQQRVTAMDVQRSGISPYC